ncbi:chromate transporter [Gracilibacillus salinarum]|uniref:Chromate transporter n=1 Tax=Gracilibacillus salinarum TaxID=2932255 RepID=A0ABY4GKY0_9BACI|nr:chromate transporter [Gracilibacillus salinarum]UOQ84097.1 chromate transporter [Gracilibacillus salinarum]
MELITIFWTFLLIGFVSFGGGYAMLPLIETEVTSHHWMSTQELTDVIAVAGMSPGPIATNSAIFVGYHVANIPGALMAALGMVIPSFLIILLLSAFFYRIHHHKFVKSAFYGLRPIITGLIAYAALKFALSNQLISSVSWQSLSLCCIFVLALLSLIKWQIHPVVVIVMSGVAGVVLF